MSTILPACFPWSATQRCRPIATTVVPAPACRPPLCLGSPIPYLLRFPYVSHCIQQRVVGPGRSGCPVDPAQVNPDYRVHQTRPAKGGPERLQSALTRGARAACCKDSPAYSSRKVSRLPCGPPVRGWHAICYPGAATATTSVTHRPGGGGPAVGGLRLRSKRSSDQGGNEETDESRLHLLRKRGRAGVDA